MSNVDFSTVRVGDRLPELNIDITAKLITGAAIASRDYQNVHRDQDAARELGSPNIFMNILNILIIYIYIYKCLQEIFLKKY